MYTVSLFIFFHDTATTESYPVLHTLSLHYALPISILDLAQVGGLGDHRGQFLAFGRQIGTIGLPAGLTVDHLNALAVGMFERDAEHEDLAQTRREWRELELHPGRQAVLGLRDPFGQDRKSTRLTSLH